MCVLKNILRDGFIFLIHSLLLYEHIENNVVLKQNSNRVVDLYRGGPHHVYFLWAKYLVGPLCV